MRTPAITIGIPVDNQITVSQARANLITATYIAELGGFHGCTTD